MKFKKNRKNILSEFVPKITEHKLTERPAVGASACNRCICQSCTGFGCPWLTATWRDCTDGYKHASRRCLICGFNMIYDCDFYTNHRRRRFFVEKRYVFKETKLDKLMKAVDEIKKLLTK